MTLPRIELCSPVQDKLEGYARANAATRPLIVATPGIYAGQTLALCGAGPSLADNLPTGADHVWACNSALPYLVARGCSVSAGVGIDQTAGLLNEWADPPAVPYYLASTVDPELVKHLRAHDRQCIFFHSYVGLVDEFEMYREAWPPAFCVTDGHTVIQRALILARWMGFAAVDVYGADCALRDGVTHANGVTAEDAYGPHVVMEGTIDGRLWRTRPDMLMAAVELARFARDDLGAVRLVGDTLPAALVDKPEAYLDDVCRRLAPGEPIPGESDG